MKKQTTTKKFQLGDAPSFNIGDKVHVQDDQEVCTVKSFTCNEDGYSYTVTSKSWDPTKHEVMDGVKNCREAELSAVKETTTHE